MTLADPALTLKKTVIASRRFTVADQEAFAAISGDSNPMHMDPLAARRTQAGAPVVHGVHVLLWALDSIAAAITLEPLQQIRVQFEKFMYVGRTLSIEFEQSDPTAARAIVISDGLAAMTAVLRFGPKSIKPPPEVGSTPIPAETPRDLQLAQMGDRSGWLSSPVDAHKFADAFPHAAAALNRRRLSGLAQTSRLVGMECPGLHSIFASLTVDLMQEIGEAEGIGYRVSRADERFRRVNMTIAGDGLSGQVAAFVRLPPVGTPDMAEIARHVDADAFAGTTSLVVGGSRGLGALTAKLLAAGGGRVIVTFARGRQDAEQLCAEIDTVCGEGTCRALSLDAMQPVGPQIGSLAVSHLYYFATPQIFVQKSELFIPALYAEFSRIYVDAFYETCVALSSGPLSAFYPSSVAVTERPEGMTEYSMAKTAGEMLCKDMERGMPALSILIDRLPRILTDQTATVARAETADPIAVMLPLIRAVQAG